VGKLFAAAANENYTTDDVLPTRSCRYLDDLVFYPGQLFDFFCKKGTRAGAGFDEIKEANSVMTIPQFKKFLKEYKIVPDLVEEARVQDVRGFITMHTLA